jgi:ribosomal protein S18 acetylase RimI-like enzyme
MTTAATQSNSTAMSLHTEKSPRPALDTGLALLHASGHMHAAPIQLRTVCESDADTIARIYASSRDEEMQLVDWPLAQKTAFLEQQCALQRNHYLKHYPAAQYYLIERNGQVQGRIYWQWQGLALGLPLSAPGHRPELRLMEITVLTAFRRQGIASTLVRALQHQAATQGACMTLHVQIGSPAQAIYAHLGFQADSTSPSQGLYQLMHWPA